MVTVTAEQMQRIDHYAIENMEIPSLVLMENAALAALSQLDLERRQSFAIFCGMGNNGGDGLALGRQLLTRGKRVIFYLVGEEAHASADFRANLRILRHMQADLRPLQTLGDIADLAGQLDRVNTLIDSLFGTGLSRPVRELQAVVIEQINEARIFTVSLDLPSGLDATTGRSWGAFVEADAVLTFECMKAGLVDNPLVHGQVRCLPIGIPRQAKAFVLGEDFDR